MNTTQTLAPRRELWAWAFYDFANSGYTTVVMTTVYSAYFVGVIAGKDLDSGTATLLWTLATATANAIVLFSAPLIGALADQRACKKTFLAVSTVVCVASTALLAFIEPGQIVPAMLLVTLSSVAFASGENLIAAFLPEIAPPQQMGRISGYGWSLGYFGGLLTLGLCLAYISHASAAGAEVTRYVPTTLLITALIFALAAAPTFIWLRERAVPLSSRGSHRRLAAGAQLGAAWSQVRATLDRRHTLRDLFRFLLSLVLFQAGVATVVVVAAIYAQEVMGFSQQQLIVLIMVVNVTAAVGAFGFGRVQDRIGSVPSLSGALLLWIAAIGISYGFDSEPALWIAGNLIGLAMGATQAGGRALIGRLTPEGRSAEYFGLWGLASRAAAILGPLSYGLISHLGADHRLALLSTLVLFVLGLALLLTVDEARGTAARVADEAPPGV